MIAMPVKITLTRGCRFCGDIYNMSVYRKDFRNWLHGELIQNAFPYLSAGEREMLLSNICPKCWDDIFETED